MSILYQSITSTTNININGQSSLIFPSKGSERSHEQLPVRGGTHSLMINSFQPTSVSFGVDPPPPHCRVQLDRGSISGLSELLAATSNHNPVPPLLLDQPPAVKLNLTSTNGRSSDVLVAVSSAVRLEGKQIDLISRKMKRLTGFRNLKLENIIDSSLIAGFVISYFDSDGPHVIDLSVRGQLVALADRVESSDQRTAR